MANEALYKKAKKLLKEEKFDQAIAVFEDIEDYEDSADMITEAQYLKACDYLDNKKYTQAVDLFEDISYYKNSGDKIKEAKYGYVLAHKNNYDDTTYEYLTSLKNSYYKDAASIYGDLYDWKVTIVGWNSDEDSTSYQSSISKWRPVYCHIELSGGTPGASTVLSVSGTLPNGNSFNHTFDEEWSDGWSGSFYWEDGIYTYPEYGSTGTIKVNFYDDDWNLVGSGSVRITN